MEIWTTTNMNKNRDKSELFNNFPVQAAMKLKKYVENRDRFLQISFINKSVPIFFVFTEKI